MNRNANMVSVDVETSGPIPGEFSLLSIGACLLNSNDDGFYVELQPISDNAVPEALAITGFALPTLRKTGRRPLDALLEFENWLKANIPNGQPIFTGFNAGFDWSFVNWYFHKYRGSNPFGYTSIDIKSFYMGLSGCEWEATKSSKIPKRYQPKTKQTHNALDDAKAQAEMFAAMLASC